MADDPARGRACVVLAVVGLYALLPTIALSAMPVTQDAAGDFTTELATVSKDDPVLGIVENIGLSSGLTDALRVYVGILAAVILLIATNAALIGVSRLTYSMGQHRQLPESLRAVHPKYRTPYIAILVFSAVARSSCCPARRLPGDDVLVRRDALVHDRPRLRDQLRKLRPLDERPLTPDGTRMWRSPGNIRMGGFELPMTAVLGGLGTFAACIVVMALDPVVLATGGGWMVAGTPLYVLYRRNKQLPLTETVKVVTLSPLGVEEVEYRSVLVAFEEDDPFSEEMVATARRWPRSAAAGSTSTRWSRCPPTCRSTPSSTAPRPRRRARSSRRS